jgi:hypothetical protein
MNPVAQLLGTDVQTVATEKQDENEKCSHLISFGIKRASTVLHFMIFFVVHWLR